MASEREGESARSEVRSSRYGKFLWFVGEKNHILCFVQISIKKHESASCWRNKTSFYREEMGNSSCSLSHTPRFYLFPLKTWQFFFPSSSSFFPSSRRVRWNFPLLYEPSFYINLRFFYAMLAVLVCELCKICESKQEHKNVVINIFPCFRLATMKLEAAELWWRITNRIY